MLCQLKGWPGRLRRHIIAKIISKTLCYDLREVKAGLGESAHHFMMWQTIANAPFFRSLELAVLDEDGVHALVFPCRRAVDGWRDALTGHFVDVEPTHWRYWGEEDEEAWLD